MNSNDRIASFGNGEIQRAKRQIIHVREILVHKVLAGRNYFFARKSFQGFICTGTINWVVVVKIVIKERNKLSVAVKIKIILVSTFGLLRKFKES